MQRINFVTLKLQLTSPENKVDSVLTFIQIPILMQIMKTD